MPSSSFGINANIKASGGGDRIVHKFASGVNDGADTTKVRSSNWNNEHQIISNPIGCKATGSGTSNITSNNTWFALALSAEDWDTDSFHDNVTNNSRITIPTGLGGKYLIIGHYGINGGSANVNYDIDIFKNGNTSGELALQRESANTTFVNISTMVVLDLAAGDYVQVGCRITSGATLSTYAHALTVMKF
jgi:hypothetical protein